MAAALPFVARLYGAYAVGLFASVLTLSQLGAIVATGRVEQILPRIQVADRWTVLISASALAAGLAIPFGWAIAALNELDAGTVAASVFLVGALGLYAVSNMVLLAHGEFGQVARLRLTNAAATAGLQVCIGVLAPSAALLIASYGAGSLVACLHAGSVMKDYRRKRGPRTVFEVNREERLLRFMGAVGGSALITSATLGLPVVALTFIYGEGVAASYFLARRVLMVPGQIVSTTLSEVSYSVLARATLQQVAAHVRRWLVRLVPSALMMIVVSVAIAYPIQMLLGPGYVSVAWVMVILSVSGAAQLVAQSMSSILLVLRLEWLRLLVNSVRLLLVVLALVWAWIVEMSFLPAVVLLSAVTVMGLLGLLGATLFALRRRVMESL